MSNDTKLKLVVNNGLSVFMENILHVNLDDQWNRKMYHRKVMQEFKLLLKLRGVKVYSA